MDENSEDEGRVGDLIVAAFDEAARFSTDPVEVSQLATRAVTHILERTRRAPPSRAELVPIDPPLSPGGRRATAVVLRLVPAEGPKFRLGRSSILRLVRPRVPLRLCPNPEPPQPLAPSGDAPSSVRPGPE